ncbi:hypothetical protein BV25DRAFT_127093 [Artomyces pyxidatus]|uniref:Uncharacterized protein n=1 Tax=Artomyces pyxidatus TaxID=48021 RepID=A0ACB8T9T4_9AGAM|nr:hypothetical protein BV25DRAFT_127093 [Artomyces pyxidatus]
MYTSWPASFSSVLILSIHLGFARSLSTGEMDIRAVLDAIVDVQKSRYAGVSSSVIILYDHVLTLDQEVQFIWKEPWSMGKVLFLASRYYGVFAAIFNDYAILSSWRGSEHLCVLQLALFLGFLTSLLSQNSCDFWISWQGWTAVFIGGTLAQVILLLRVRALYDNRYVTVSLLVGLVMTMGTCGTIMGTSLHEKSTFLIIAEPDTFCVLDNIPPYLPAFFIPSLVFESWLGALAIYKWIKEVGVTLASPRIAPALLQVLVRDSVTYFIVMSSLYILNGLIWLKTPALLDLPATFLLAFSCVMGNRLILNLRSHAQRHSQAVRSSGRPSEMNSLFDFRHSLHSGNVWSPRRIMGGSNMGTMDV